MPSRTFFLAKLFEISDMKNGRPRTPVERLKLQGTFRKDRHADRAGSVQATGEPERPDELSDDAAWLWDFVVPELVTLNLAQRIDTPALIAMCERWGEYKSEANTKPERNAAFGNWLKIATRFGLTKIDREAIKAEAPEPVQELGARKRA